MSCLLTCEFLGYRIAEYVEDKDIMDMLDGILSVGDVYIKVKIKSLA